MHNLNDDDWDIIFERNTDDYYLGNIVQDINIGKIKEYYSAYVSSYFNRF